MRAKVREGKGFTEVSGGGEICNTIYHTLQVQSKKKQLFIPMVSENVLGVSD